MKWYMFRGRSALFFRVVGGNVLVDFKLLSRDHKKSIVVEGAVVDPKIPVTVAPLSWLERLRSPSSRLPTGYFTEKRVLCGSSYDSLSKMSPVPFCGDAAPGNVVPLNNRGLFRGGVSALGRESKESHDDVEMEGIIGGPLVMYITGQNIPVVVNPLFVSEKTWKFKLHRCFVSPFSNCLGDNRNMEEELDLRLGLDAIEQCSLFAELHPGGLLYRKLPRHGEDVQKCTEPAHSVLRRYGMACGLSESPLNRRPWTRMKYMFIDELQRGPKLTEFVGHNPRCGTPWRFSQHNKYFRQGIWKEIIRKNEMNPGLHTHSSWQKSHQQSVPEVPFMAPFP